jgi:protein TonB
MTQSLAPHSVLREDDDGLEAVGLVLTSAPSAAPPRLNQLTLVGRSGSNRREVALVLSLSALLHAGVAAAALRSGPSSHVAKPLSQVELEMSRPQRVTPPPPPPPPVAKPEVKPLAAPRPRERAPEPVQPTPAPTEAPLDTGSSAGPAEDGELFAGSGGLGTAAPPPPAPPAPKAVAPVPAPIVQAREGANYLKNPRPGYPGLARREGWEGTATLRVQVGENGRPRSVQLQRSSGHDVLDTAAADAVKNWTFAPATQGGQPVAGWVTVPIVFKLQ